MCLVALYCSVKVISLCTTSITWKLPVRIALYRMWLQCRHALLCPTS